MPQHRLISASPYAICLAAAAVLWWLTGQIDYGERPGIIAPTFWPRVAIALIAVSALVELARILFSSSPEVDISGIGEALEGAAEDDDEAPRQPALLIIGMALTVAFAVVVVPMGFVFSTFLYLLVFMYAGGYRNHVTIWASSIIGTLVFAAIFLKLVYVSVPRGTAPFDSITQGVLDLLGLLF